ncbi:hypothetical protein B0H17DRAFT_1301304 [Mycena rosella]|uniref:Uncharacterized protein n=1 Tax=Mycena rosella TaxID=1033263 RepID=A0AAD7GGN1_MYCRO|nr:hypothetical protein B0H17DRAFT_1301304 [Mycena rosella]
MKAALSGIKETKTYGVESHPLFLAHRNMELSGIRLLTAALAVAMAATSKAERLAACGPNVDLIRNTTLEADGKALQYTVAFCPANPPARVEARDDWEIPLENGVIHDLREQREVERRQTCTQCPCANGSIHCFCSNIPGGDSRTCGRDWGCSNSTPPGHTIPITADCTALASLMVHGAPAPANPSMFELPNNLLSRLIAPSDFPVQTNGYYNIPASSLLTWEFKGCGFAFYNPVGSANVCAKDLANSVKALAAYCPDINHIDAQFQNDRFKRISVYNPAGGIPPFNFPRTYYHAHSVYMSYCEAEQLATSHRA